MKYYIEKYYPLFLTIAIVLAIYKYEKFIADFNILIPLVSNSSLTISATLLGFLLTILTIINSIATRRMRFVKDTGLYPVLMGYLSKAIISNITVVSICFILFFIKRTEIYAIVLKIIDYCFIFICFLNLFLTIRFAKLFIRLLANDEE